MKRHRTEPDSHRFSLRILFGLFEADASGSVAIGAVLVALAMVITARWCGLV